MVVALPWLLVKMDVERRMTAMDVVGSDLVAVEGVVAAVVAGAEKVTAAPEGQVHMAFWPHPEGGGSESSRTVTAPVPPPPCTTQAE